MYRHPKMDLSYAHEVDASLRDATRSSVLQKPRELGLKARLLGIKRLYDMEHDRSALRRREIVAEH